MCIDEPGKSSGNKQSGRMLQLSPFVGARPANDLSGEPSLFEVIVSEASDVISDGSTGGDIGFLLLGLGVAKKWPRNVLDNSSLTAVGK